MLTAGRADTEPTESASRRGGREHHEVACRAARAARARACGREGRRSRRAPRPAACVHPLPPRRARVRRDGAARRASLPGSRLPARGRPRRRPLPWPAPIAATRVGVPCIRRRSSRAPFAAGDDHPVVTAHVHRLVAQRLRFDQRAVDDVVPERLQAANELLLLASGSGHDHPHETKASSSRATVLRVCARAPLDPGAVLVGDERGQRRAVVMRRHGSEAAAADERNAAALGFDAPARLRRRRRAATSASSPARTCNASEP